MLITKTVKIKTTGSPIKFYKEKGYEASHNSVIEVKVEDLMKSSAVELEVQCDFCGVKKIVKYVKYRFQTKDGTKPYACNKCTALKLKYRYNEEFGVDNPFQLESVKEKIKQTNLERYGNKCSLHGDTEKAKKIQEKVRDTMVEKYGVENSSQSEEIQKKRIESFKENIEGYKENFKKTVLEKYGVPHFTQAETYKIYQFKKYQLLIRERYIDLDVKNVNRDGSIEFMCPECNEFKILRIHLLHQRYKYTKKLCLDCNPLFSSSKTDSIGQLEVHRYVESLDLKCYKDRIELDGKELDIYVPEKNLAIEYNGLFWHSELVIKSNYHADKLDMCIKRGIKLIQIWEDDWYGKRDIVKSRIDAVLGKTKRILYARKCTLKEVDSKESFEFLEKNHLQGPVNSSVRIGLFYRDEMVSLMTFGKPRKIYSGKGAESVYELYRFCNVLYTGVTGGASKLFKYFVEKYDPLKIISFADREWTNTEIESVYKMLGFKFLGSTGLNYWWVVDETRKNRFNFRKDILIKEGADPNLTEVEIMHDRKSCRCFGSGNLKFEWTNKNPSIP